MLEGSSQQVDVIESKTPWYAFALIKDVLLKYISRLRSGTNAEKCAEYLHKYGTGPPSARPDAAVDPGPHGPIPITAAQSNSDTPAGPSLPEASVGSKRKRQRSASLSEAEPESESDDAPPKPKPNRRNKALSPSEAAPDSESDDAPPKPKPKQQSKALFFSGSDSESDHTEDEVEEIIDWREMVCRIHMRVCIL
jgi:hypothetical protein